LCHQHRKPATFETTLVSNALDVRSNLDEETWNGSHSRRMRKGYGTEPLSSLVKGFRIGLAAPLAERMAVVARSIENVPRQKSTGGQDWKA
jgi:hypothetical protein